MSVSPPRPKGPPLNALRAFEAAARLGGFANAAEELGVTPGAISQHIKALEEWVGMALFERRSQGVKLTQTGADLAPEFAMAFDKLGDAVRQLRAQARNRTLHIAALPSIAQLWLSPRLPDLRQRLPDVRLSISATELPPNLSREMFDVSLFFRRPSGGPHEVVLNQDVLYPVCAPGLARDLRTYDDLARQTLLHDAFWPDDWPQWAAYAGLEMPGLERGPSFSLYSVALEEAKHGAGVLIGHHALVARDIRNGALVAPFETRMPTQNALVLETATIPKPGDDMLKIVDLLTSQNAIE